MNKDEARKIIDQELEVYRAKNYSELIKMIDGEVITYELTTPNGTWYQIEILAFWDDRLNGDVRVVGAIDDGGWSAFSPITSDFIKSRDNKFVGE